MRWMALALLTCGCASSGSTSAGVDPLHSARVTAPPTIDGLGTDAAWRNAKPLELTLRRVWPAGATGSARAWIRSVHTDTHLYFLVIWEDATRDDAAHKPWVWDAAKNAYAEGPEREDMAALAFELSGAWTPDMLSGAEGAWDLWQWKATRTDPQGYAMDRSHRYTKQKPEGKAREHRARDGSTIWIARPEDAGDTVETKQAAPRENQGERVPQYLPGTPTGSAADVRAKGTWADGKWTLEFERKLDTGHADDTVFRRSRTCSMAMSLHDRTGDMDQASDTILLKME